MSKQSISILGCGWLGLPLAISLQKKEYAIKGSTTSTDKLEILSKNNIKAHQIIITDTQIKTDTLASFLDSKILIINFPPKRRDDIYNYHLAQMELLLSEIKKSTIQHVLFISSTSVYPDTNGIITEKETLLPEKESGKALLAIEKMLQQQTNFSTTILRFAGLIGYDRMPGKFLAGKKNLENGDAPINVIHQDDCVAIIHKIIEQNKWKQIYNACADEHPKRKEYYTLAAQKIGLETPTFAPQKTFSFKIIDATKLKNDLNYQFIHPSPLVLLNQ